MTTGLSPEADTALRAHIRALLTQAQAHEMLDDVLVDFPTARAGQRVHGLPYSASEILWHLRFTLRDILDFVQGGAYEHPKWPDGYWPHDPEGSAREWDAQVAALHADMDALLALLDDPATDLLAVVPNGVGAGGQTWLREFLLVADHNAYHVAQLALLRRLLT
ncbi:DinB family protein [Deinococcus sp.]|uniref:DinB family protein n=1 Tax=Deinococcus sp. TaxID=47478 RepID=UPI002869B643|nr:DinB family protein [Deinococcus sp.]